MDYLAVVTAVAAFGGLVLGVLNTWKVHIEDKVKLKVMASLAKTDEGTDYVRVLVTNMSRFPVAPASIELVLKGGGTRGFPTSYVNRAPIEPRRNSSYGYFLQGHPDPQEHLLPEDVESCVLRTECGYECEVAVAQPLNVA